MQGELLNQFSIDEHDGYLRLVTSDWNRQSLYIMQQTGKKLKVVATIANLSPRERLYSVRFIEDRAFAVTFRTVDPLFAIESF